MHGISSIVYYQKIVEKRFEANMSLQEFKSAFEAKKLICPKCKKPVLKFEKYAETIDAVRDGFNIQEIDSHGARVTLICANEGCSWKERTEYWDNYLED